LFPVDHNIQGHGWLGQPLRLAIHKSGQRQTVMKWRHWSILIVLVLLNYIIFSTAFTQLARQRYPGLRSTRTPQPTFTSVAPSAVAWIVLPTSTLLPTGLAFMPTPTVALTATTDIVFTVQPAATGTPPPATIVPPPTAVPPVPTATPSGGSVVHIVKPGETLSQIAAAYHVAAQAIVDANGLSDPNHIVAGQELIIPVSGEVMPTATVHPQATRTPAPKPTKKPPTATTTPKPAAKSFQYTAEVIWDPLVAPNCAGPAISKNSLIKDGNGNPVNGARVEINCYDNIFLSHPSGNPGEYDPGHYDFAFGQHSPQDWTCTARVFDLDGQPVASSQAVSIHFDTNDCQPYGSGHQVAIVNWTKHW
jgi:LysM repeat protein